MSQQIAKEIAEILNFEHKLYRADDSNIESDYFNWFEIGLTEGFTPLMIGTSDIILEILESHQQIAPHYAKNLIAASQKIDINALFQRKNELLKNLDTSSIGDPNEIFEEIEADNNQEYCFNTLDEENCDFFLLVKFPTTNPWELASYLPMGGFNDCPIPEEQTAIFKYWYEKHGMIPALVQDDAWECWLKDPINDDQIAKELACEHYLFCHDIVDQGLESIELLAEVLKRSKNWFFWWD